MSAKNIIVSLLIIIGSILFYTLQRMEVLRISYEIDKLRNEKNELSNKNKFLSVEVASLKSLDRVERMSKDELGLITPDKFEIIELEGENEYYTAPPISDWYRRMPEGNQTKNNRYGLAGIKTDNNENKGVDTLQ